MSDYERTNSLFTFCSQGLIHHLNKNGIRMPVKLETKLVDTEYGPKLTVFRNPMSGLPVACQMVSGKFVYATPGGGEFVA